MEAYSRDVSPEAMAHGVEENGIEFLLAMGRAGGSEERNEPRVQWVIGGAPISYHNCVVGADLAPVEVGPVIEESVERFRAYGVPGSWHVGPSMRPEGLGRQLLAHGFSYGGDDIGMGVDLGLLNESITVPEGLRVERVLDERDLDDWAYALSLGFGEGEIEAKWVRGTYARIGFGNSSPFRHYLARVRGLPVATSTLYLAAGVAGIYFVSTVPDYRRQGLGAAVTLTPLLDARAMGYRVGVLGASDMGYPVYRRLGFQEYCRIELYDWAEDRL